MAALWAMAAYCTAATTFSSRPAGGSTAGAARERLLATGMNSATSTRHCSQIRRCRSKAAASSGSRDPRAHPATSGCSRACRASYTMETSLHQRAAESSHPVEAPGLDRAEGKVKLPGDLALGQAVLLAQADHLGLFRLEALQGLSHDHGVKDLVDAVGHALLVQAGVGEQGAGRWSLVDVGGGAAGQDVQVGTDACLAGVEAPRRPP